MKSKRENKECIMNIRTSKILKQTIMEAAYKQGLDLSEYARVTLLRQAQKDLESSDNE